MIGCLAGLSIGMEKILIMSASIIIAAAIFLILKKFEISTKSKVVLIYGHLVFLFFPFVVFTTNLGCSALCIECANNVVNLIILSLPTTFLISILSGFFIIPGVYMVTNKKSLTENISLINFVKMHAEKLHLKMPKLYIIDNPSPIAYSFRSFKSAIFLSAGLLDLLNKKEIEAVVLHELGHIKQKASMIKLSFSFLKIFSPFSLLVKFHHDSLKEERDADEFAISIQKTSQYINSAKKKVDDFFELEDM